MNLIEHDREEKPVVVVDGRRLTAKATGVGRYLSILLDRWAINAGQLPFEPFVILHQDRPEHLDPWKSVFRHEVVGSRLPGWIWENVSLCGDGRRFRTLFAPANLVPMLWRGPVVLVVHDTFCEHADAQIPRLARWRFRGRYRRSAERADLILTPSRSTADDVVRSFGIDSRRVRVVRPGISRPPTITDDFDDTHYESIPEEPYVLFVGKKSARRSFPSVVEAVERISKQGTPLKLIRVGPIDGEPTGSRVLTDLGHVPDNVLTNLYRQALALVWPSAREGFGLPVLEAMANGCPVITRPVNALAELCQGCCLEIADASTETLVMAISRLIDRPELRAELIESGLERSRAFDCDVFADSVAAAIAEVSAHSSSHQRFGMTGRNVDLGDRAVRIQH